MWDRSDARFITVNGKAAINKRIEERLRDDYGIDANIDIFRLISFPDHPAVYSSTSNVNTPMGYLLTPFTDTATNRSYCPRGNDYQSNIPLLNILGDYMPDTEGLYLAEKEPDVIVVGGQHKLVYGTIFVRESTLLNYGFYIENGLKIRIDRDKIHTKSVNFYWPVSSVTDPMTSGGRKIFTVRSPDSLNEDIPAGTTSTIQTSDKRIGCIPKN
jgi:hypothetical protein